MPRYREGMKNLVLVGVDGSSGSAGAADWALAEAAARKWSILFATVVPLAPVTDPQVEAAYFRSAVRDAERILGPLIAQAEVHGITAASQVIAGRAGDVLVRLSAEASLGVVGRRIRSGFVSRLGSVSAAFAAHSSCSTAVIPETWSPVLSAGDSAPASDGRTLAGQVVVSVEAGPAAPHLLAVAAEMAQRDGVPLCAVTVGPNGTEQGGDPWLTDLLHRTRQEHPGLQCGSRTLSGSPAHEIAQAARGARLLVIGTRGLSGIPGIVRGSVSQAVLESTSSPVLIVPSRHPGKRHN